MLADNWWDVWKWHHATPQLFFVLFLAKLPVWQAACLYPRSSTGCQPGLCQRRLDSLLVKPQHRNELNIDLVRFLQAIDRGDTSCQSMVDPCRSSVCYHQQRHLRPQTCICFAYINSTQQTKGQGGQWTVENLGRPILTHRSLWHPTDPCFHPFSF